MKLKWCFPSDFSPETFRKFLIDKGALEYLINHHPEIREITILDSHSENDKLFVKLRYNVKGSLPWQALKILKRISQSFIADLILDAQNNITTMEINPVFFPNRINTGGRIYFEKLNDRWVQHVEGDITVNILGVGVMIEKLIEKKFHNIFALENQLRNEYIATQIQ